MRESYMEFVTLTSEELAFFEANGFLVVRGALEKNLVESLIRAGDRLIASDRVENRQTANERWDSFRNCVALDDAFLPLLAYPPMLSRVVQILSPNIHLTTSHVIYKYPDPEGTPEGHRDPGWHRDIANTPADLGHEAIPKMEVKVAYYLTDLGQPKSGVTLFSPGSHLLKTPLSRAPGKADPDEVAELLLEPGDAVIFENRTWHAGGLNLSGKIRKAVMFGYGYTWLAPMDYKVQSEALVSKVDAIGRQLLGAPSDPSGRFTYDGTRGPIVDWARKNGVAYPRSHGRAA